MQTISNASSGLHAGGDAYRCMKCIHFSLLVRVYLLRRCTWFHLGASTKRDSDWYNPAHVHGHQFMIAPLICYCYAISDCIISNGPPPMFNETGALLDCILSRITPNETHQQPWSIVKLHSQNVSFHSRKLVWSSFGLFGYGYGNIQFWVEHKAHPDMVVVKLCSHIGLPLNQRAGAGWWWYAALRRWNPKDQTKLVIIFILAISNKKRKETTYCKPSRGDCFFPLHPPPGNLLVSGVAYEVCVPT